MKTGDLLIAANTVWVVIAAILVIAFYKGGPRRPPRSKVEPPGDP